MNVLILTDVQKYRYLSAMKIARYYEDDHIYFNIVPDVDIDLCYVSKLFSFTSMPAVPLGVKPIVGGIYDRLPKEIEYQYPFYELYPDIKVSLGKVSTGCNKLCYFCHIPKAEGKFKRFQHPAAFHNPKWNCIELLDNNWLDDKEWFMITSNWIIDNKLSLIEHGFDVRLIDSEVAEQITHIRFKKDMKIAFDNYVNVKSVIRGVTELRKVGFPVRSRLLCYCYLDNNDDWFFDDLIKRLAVLKQLNVTPYIMYNIDNKPSRRTNAIRRFCNVPQLWWSGSSFTEYCDEQYITSFLSNHDRMICKEYGF